MRLAIACVFLLAISAPAWAQTSVEPCAPTGVEAERMGVVVRISWDEVPGATSYTVYRAQGDGNMTAAIIVQAPANETIDTQVESGFDYTYRVTATVGGVELPDCGRVAVEAGGPCAPHVDAVAAGSRIDVSWTALPVADAYHLYRAEGGGELSLLAVIDASTQAYSDADVEAGTTYEYEVRAVVDGEERAACNAVTVTSIPFFPQAVGLLAAGVAAVGYAFVRRR